MTCQAEKLRGFLKELLTEWDYKNANVDVQAISSRSAGYTSALYVAAVSAPPKEDIQLFAKVANLSANLRAINDIFSVSFEKECFFYTEVAVAFENLYNKHNVHRRDRLYIPTFYGFKSTIMEETLVLENLEAVGYSTFDGQKSLDWAYACKAVEELAKFHAIGVAYRIENGGKLDQIYSKSQMNWLADKKVKDVFLTQAIKMGTQRVKEEYREKMQKFFKNHNDFLDDMEKLLASTNNGFLIHGEYRPVNLMHRNHNGELDIVPIDYQTYQPGMLAYDLMYFIWFASDEVFRRDHYQQLIELYYKTLTQDLLNLDINISDVYPRNVFENELESVKFLGLFIGLTMIPLTTIDSKNRPKFDKFEDLMLEPNQLGLERINGIVGDYIRWGII